MGLNMNWRKDKKERSYTFYIIFKSQMVCLEMFFNKAILIVIIVWTNWKIGCQRHLADNAIHKYLRVSMLKLDD